MPLVTVVIPTRNRGELLRFALSSVLAQEYDDYEVLVSNNNSRDDTADIVAEFACSRLRYVRTDTDLPMPDHYEFALQHVRGHYVTYLGDDDALTPECLRRASSELAARPDGVVAWSWADYCHANWFEAGQRNSVSLKHYSHQVSVHESRSALRRLFRLGRHIQLPLITNALYPMSLVRALRGSSIDKRFFCQPAPDFTSCAALLASIGVYIWIDGPLAVHGYAAQGIGAGQGYNLSAAARTFEREFGSTTVYRDVPLHATTTINVVAQSLLEAKRQWPALLAANRLSSAQYFVMMRENLDTLAGNGADVAEARREFRAVLSRSYPWLRLHPRMLLYVPTRAAKRLTRRAINRAPRAKRVEASVRGWVPSTSVRGEDAGFANIASCAAWLLSARSEPVNRNETRREQY